MRPNVDIPWTIHGQIKEYAEQQSITIEEAYIETLELGTDRLPNFLDSDVVQFDESEEWLPFGPRLVGAQGEESHHINWVTTSFPHIYNQDLPVVTRTNRRDMSKDEFISCLSALESTGYIGDDWFTLHQLGGAKIGRGISNLSREMDDLEHLFQEADFPLYKQGSGIYITSLPRDSEYLILRFELPKHTEVVTNVTLSLMIDGYPVGGREYHELASSFGYKELFNARSFHLPRAGMRFEDPVKVSPETELYKEGNDDEPLVGGLLIENPFQSKPELLDHIQWNEDDDPTDLAEAKRSLETLPNYDVLYCELDHHFPASDDVDYRLEAISAVYLSPLFKRNSVWNISPRVDW